MENSETNEKEKLYLKKRKKFYYLGYNGNCPSQCLICGANDNITTHHVIPKRLKCPHKALAGLKIKVCKNCHIEIDKGNNYILACKALTKILYETTKGEIVNNPEFLKISENLKINLLDWQNIDALGRTELSAQALRKKCITCKHCAQNKNKNICNLSNKETLINSVCKRWEK